ncbi:MAG TPA: hypothetical protein PKA82_15950 [Pyrinomonadaceae bacterium]|nr:hypothetical protein [Pyrinomonadaceae bacterium]
MAAKAKRFLITHESREVMIVRAGIAKRKLFCPRCNDQMEMVTIEEAARIASIPMRQIFYATEDCRLHSIDTDRGILLVCLRSLGGL